MATQASMKVTCPNCNKVFKARSEWAGKPVKCPACKETLTIPEDDDAGAPGLALDLDSLNQIEQAGQAVVRDQTRKQLTLKEAQAASAAEDGDSKPKAPADPKIRICPRCGQKVRSDDVFIDLICKHCGGAIPGHQLASSEKGRYTGGMSDRTVTATSFYQGFMGAAGYPVPAIAHIVLGMVIALAAIAVPMLAVLAFTAGSGLNPIANKDGGPDFGWVGIFLTVMFSLEAVYFGSVGYYILIDTIRATTSGTETPPGLTWNVINLGSALGGYAALLAFYAVIILCLVTISNGHFPDSGDDFAALGSPVNLIIIAILTFGVPMNVIGLASSHAFDGLNPVRIAKSIGPVIGAYFFLFLIVIIYLAIYIGVMTAVMSWAGPIIKAAAQQGMSVGIVRVLLGIAAWGVVMGAGFYFAYSIGRVIGLFSRSYREHLDFEL